MADTGRLLDFAFRYAAAGLATFPVDPATKAPRTPNGMKDATTDIEAIERWWRTWPDSSIAARIPPGVIVLDLDPRHGALEVWEALARHHGEIGATRTHWSGRGDGGRHVWLTWPHHSPPSVRRLNAWAREHDVGHQIPGTDRWTAGIDVLRHQHRYSILPPSVHASSGGAYRWDDTAAGPTAPIAVCPDWLVELLTKPPAATSAPVDAVRTPDPESIAEWFSDAHTWAEVLTPHGWTHVGGDPDGDGGQWKHPTATSAVSATIRYGRLFVYSPNTPFEVTEDSDPHGYTRFRAWAVLAHAGDLSAAARAARALPHAPDRRDVVADWIATFPAEQASAAMTPEALSAAAEALDELDHGGWAPVDLSDYLDGSWEPPRPTVGRLNDDCGLFYAGRMNAVWGESGSGKSWVALAACADEIRDGHHVIYIDLEDHPGSVTERIVSLVGDINMVRDRFHYIHPAIGWDVEPAARLRSLVDDLSATLVVIDSVGEQMAADGQDPNADDEVTRWHRRMPRLIASWGPSVVLIDHIPKAKDAPKGFAIGSQRKRAAIDGIAYRIETRNAPARGQVGQLNIECAKDRSGAHANGAHIGSVTVDASVAGRTGWVITQASDKPTEFRPTEVMERISEFLSGRPDGASKTLMEDAVKGKRDTIRDALRVLLDEGYVSAEERRGPGGGITYRHTGLYQQPSTEWGRNDT